MAIDDSNPTVTPTTKTRSQRRAKKAAIKDLDMEVLTNKVDNLDLEYHMDSSKRFTSHTPTITAPNNTPNPTPGMSQFNPKSPVFSPNRTRFATPMSPTPRRHKKYPKTPGLLPKISTNFYTPDSRSPPYPVTPNSPLLSQSHLQDPPYPQSTVSPIQSETERDALNWTPLAYPQELSPMIEQGIHMPIPSYPQVQSPMFSPYRPQQYPPRNHIASAPTTMDPLATERSYLFRQLNTQDSDATKLVNRLQILQERLASLPLPRSNKSRSRNKGKVQPAAQLGASSSDQDHQQEQGEIQQEKDVEGDDCKPKLSERKKLKREIGWVKHQLSTTQTQERVIIARLIELLEQTPAVGQDQDIPTNHPPPYPSIETSYYSPSVPYSMMSYNPHHAHPNPNPNTLMPFPSSPQPIPDIFNPTSHTNTVWNTTSSPHSTNVDDDGDGDVSPTSVRECSPNADDEEVSLMVGNISQQQCVVVSGSYYNASGDRSANTMKRVSSDNVEVDWYVPTSRGKRMSVPEMRSIWP